MTSLDQNFSDLASLMMQRRQMQNQQAQQDRANRLSDLQYNALKREEDYQTGLQGAMSAANPETVTTVEPAQPRLSLASLGSVPTAQPFQPDWNQTSPLVQAYSEGRVKTTQGKTPAQAGAEYALLNNRPKDARELLDLNKLLAAQAAQARAYGSPEKAAEIEVSADRMAKGVDLLTKWKKAGGIEYAKQQAAAMPELFADTDLSKFSDVSGINTVDLGNGQLVVWSDENPGQLHLSAVPKPDEGAMLDKRFANQQKLQADQIAAQDRRTQMQIEAADRRASNAAAQKDRAPGKILPAGQLESIADMKRVKDVLAEASNDMASGKVSTGPVTGRLQSLGSKIGAADDDFVNVQQKLQTAQNIMLKLRSGAAVTESEYARFLKEYPTPNDPPAVFKRKMANTLAYANTLMDDKMTIYEEGGYKVPQSARSGSKPATTARQPARGKAPRTAADYLNKFK